jgi:hypothetical protein
MVPQKPEVNRKMYEMGPLDKLLGEAASLIQELHGIVSSLPPVAADGSSPCKDAKELYDRKEHVAGLLQVHRGVLGEYQRYVKKEIERCKHNVSVIETKGEAINNAAPALEFSEAYAAQCRELARYEKESKAIIRMDKQIKAALEAAARKRFPGRSPRNGPGSDDEGHSPDGDDVDLPMDGQTPPNGDDRDSGDVRVIIDYPDGPNHDDLSDETSDDDELADLLDMGPLEEPSEPEDSDE